MTNASEGRERAVAPMTLRGRELEAAAFGERLRDARAGLGSVVLVEGGAGVGKSRLLAEAQVAAKAAGFRVGSSAAVPGDDAVSMAPLMSTLFDGTTPILDRGHVAEGSFPDRPAWLVHRLEALLEQAARRTPVLVCIDDIHWLDRGTAAALRVLPQRLIDQPIVWLFAYRSQASSPTLTDLVAHLMGFGAETIALESFDDASVEQVVAEIVRAEPTTELLRFAGRAAGSTSLLVELVGGLVDEGLVHVADGRAELDEARLPQRLCDMTRDTLAASVAVCTSRGCRRVDSRQDRRIRPGGRDARCLAGSAPGADRRARRLRGAGRRRRDARLSQRPHP